MSTGVIAVLLLGVTSLILAKQNKDKKEKEAAEKEQSETKSSEEETSEDFDKKYFEGIEKGEPYQQFLILGGQQDCALIRSLLAADDIPSFVENENVNRMYGGVASAVTGVFAIKLYILVKDYEKAYEIVCDYAKSKKEEFAADEETKTDIRKVAAATVTGLFFAPYPVNAEQKSMGITILPKVEKQD